MALNMAALKKILGQGAIEVGGAAKGMGSILGAGAKDVGSAFGHVKAGGKLGEAAHGLADSAKYGMKELGNVAKKHPYGTAALGVGAGAATAGAGKGIHELLAALEDDGDEDDLPMRKKR